MQRRKRSTRFRRSLHVGVLLAVAACGRVPEPPAAGHAPDVGGVAKSNVVVGPDSTAQEVEAVRLRALLDSLAQAARRVASDPRAPDPAACRTAPVGVKPCGGPRGYLVWSVASSDSAALYRALDSLAVVDRRLAEMTGEVSDCMLELPPPTEIRDGVCHVASGG
jgi:hypothetical protein